MKTNNIIIGICALLIVSIYFNTRQFKIAQERKTHMSDLLASVNNGGFAPVVGVKKLKDGASAKVFKETPISDNNAVKNAVTGGYADTIAQALKVALSEIAELKSINANLQGQVKLTRSNNDTGTIATKPLMYSDRYLTAHFNPLTDSLDYQYNIQLNAVRRKKHNIWDIYSPDPNLTINSLRTFTIDATQRKHRWGLGLSAGYAYGFHGWMPYIGLGVNYNIIEF